MRLSKAEILETLVSDDKWLDLVNCEGIDLSGVNFEGAHLAGAYFFKVNLNGANFKNVYLVDATFVGADIRGVNFEGARLAGANFARATWDEKTNWRNVDGLKHARNLPLSHQITPAMRSR